MTIYTPQGQVLYEAPITASAIIKRELMGDYYIEMSFDVAEPISVGRGCYILYDKNKFEIISNVSPEHKYGGYSYTLRFEAQQSQLKRCKVFWRTTEKDVDGTEIERLEVSFSNTTNLSQFGSLIVDNINAFLGTDLWELAYIPEDLDTAFKAISFSGDTCWDALATIAETFDIEWWTAETADKVILHFGKLESGDEVNFNEGEIITNIAQKNGDDAAYGTRFYVFGSTRNLPEDYASTEQGGITNHITEKRLHLPNGLLYIDAKEGLQQSDIVEQVVFFDDVYPTNVETITTVYTSSEEVIEGSKSTVYSCYCKDTPFTPDNIIQGVDMEATFTSGNLNGHTFGVAVNTETATFNKRFKIIPKVLDANSGLILPNEVLKPEKGDKFILTGVTLPKDRVAEAEQTLLEVATEYAQKHSSDTDVYDCVTNAVYCHNNDCNYELGQKVVVRGRTSRIQGYEKRLYDQYQAIYTVGDNSAYSRLASIEKTIAKNAYADRVGIEANIIRAKGDNTTPSDYNIYSALASETYFLHKRKGGVIYGETDFRAGIKMFGKQLYDKEAKRWFFDDDVVIGGGLMMYGNTSGASVPSLFESLPIDGKTIGRNANGELTVIGGTSSGGGGGLGVDSLEAYLNGNNYAKKSDIPTTFAWSEVTSKPTTLAGYGITDAYTKGETNTEIQTLNTAIGKKWTQNDSKISNWDKAYSWGNHASAGYATQSWVEDKGYQLKITTSNKLAYSLISGTPTIPTKLSDLTDDVVKNKYLPLSGGVLTGTSSVLTINRTDGNPLIKYQANGTAVGFMGYNTSGEPIAFDGSAYRKLLHAGNYKDYALSLTGGAITGSLDISGNLTSSMLTVEGTRLNDHALLLAASDGTFTNTFGFASNQLRIGYGSTMNYQMQTWLLGYGIVFRAQGNTTNTLVLSSNGDATFTNKVTAKTFAGALAGNADTATKLATPRKIWGQEFDGTKDITGDAVFSSKVIIGDIPMYKSADGTIYLDGNLVLKGGLMMYGNTSGASVPSLFESLPIDTTTIKRNSNGQLCVSDALLARITALENKVN